jgi:hypothetical protein
MEIQRFIIDFSVDSPKLAILFDEYDVNYEMWQRLSKLNIF